MAADNLALVEPIKSNVPDAVRTRGVTESQWLTLCNSLYPGADPASVLMVLDYCAARKLDPFKKPCHIVAMEVWDARTKSKQWRDVVMPGIYEYRITAHRTNLYLGHSEPAYGPLAEYAGVMAPEWCAITAYRWNTELHQKGEYPVRVLFREAVQLKDGKANARWRRAPIQMLTKCTEAAALREAFPEEIGGEQTAEEMEGASAILDTEAVAQPAPQPAQRKSEQQPKPEAAKPGPFAPQNIGLIVEVKEREGGVSIKLDTGFICSTKDDELMKSAAALRDTKRRVDLVTTPSSDPAKYMPRLSEILPLPESAS